MTDLAHAEFPARTAAVDSVEHGAHGAHGHPGEAAPDLAPLSGLSGRIFRLCETLATLAVPAVVLALAWRLGDGMTGATAAVAAVGLLVGYVAADLGSGLVHWVFDTWGSVETPFLGRSIIRTFREHHFDDKAITRHDFVETNGSNALAALPLMLLGFTGGGDSAWSVFAIAFVITLGSLTAFTGQIHKWAHSARVPRVIAALQRARLILDARHHGEHHVAPYTKHYCITTGWCNPLLEKLNAFRVAERMINGALRRNASAPAPAESHGES